MDGEPYWADLALAGDAEAVRAFYGAVLGWTFTDEDAVGHHELVALDGDRRVPGLGAVRGDQGGRPFVIRST